MNVEKAKKVLAGFPRAQIGIFPTPLYEMKNLKNKICCTGNLMIKRDDLTGIGPGGNKIRNLEFLLGDAISKGSDIIIVSGKSQSNLCTLAVSACRKLNLDCIILHNDEKPLNMTGNQLLNHISGADMRYIGNISEEDREKKVAKLCENMKISGRHPYVIYNGASTAMGSLGYVQAVVELCVQCAEQHITIDHLFVPGGNGGLAAGVIFGAALVDAPFLIHVITVEHTTEKLKQILNGLLKDLQDLTGEMNGYSFEKCFVIHDEYRGEGWGKSTEESVHQIYDLAQIEGIYVEKVYTSKTLYGMLDIVKSGSVQGTACYLHSGGFGALFSQF